MAHMSQCAYCASGTIPPMPNWCLRCGLNQLTLAQNFLLPFGEVSFHPRAIGGVGMVFSEEKKSKTCGFLTDNKRCNVACEHRFCQKHFEEIKAKNSAKNDGHKCAFTDCTKNTTYKYCQFHFRQLGKMKDDEEQ
jgi:hypothetical protein